VVCPGFRDSVLANQSENPSPFGALIIDGNDRLVRKPSPAQGFRGHLLPLLPKPEQIRSRSTGTDQVRDASSNLNIKIDRALNCGQPLAIIDDVVERKLAAYELTIINGIPEAWIEAR
jgi:hypothetical protein